MGRKGREAGAWFADEEFWAESYAFMFREASFGEAEAEVEKIIDRTGIETGRLLDLGCGPGRYAVPLAHRGFGVTGVDRSPLLLEKAREYAESKDVEVEWIEEDMRRFTRPESFDLAISMTTSFGFLDDPADNLAVARNVHASLVPGGALLLDLMGKEVLARNFEETSATELPDGRVLIQRREITDDWSRIRADWIYLREDGTTRSFRIRLWVFSGGELRRLMRDAGFAEVALFGNLDGSAYGVDASRLIAVARKAD